MKLSSIAGRMLAILIVLTSSAVTGLALQAGSALNHSFVAPVPEDPTLALAILGGAGLAWQYFRFRSRK